MRSAIAAFVVALLVTTVVTPAVRRYAIRAGVVDAPGGRRVHTVVTPRLGGVAVMVGFFVPLAAATVIKSAVMRSFLDRPDLLTGLVLGGCVVGLVGAIDDVRSLGPWMKLTAQAVAGVIAYAFGYRIEAVSLPVLGNMDMGVLALPLTVFWFLAITNAINLIDGLDGLATGIALFTTIANFAIAYARGSEIVLLLSGALGGSLLGFLRYNFNPATIFLGDSGSMFLGFVLAAISIGGQLTKSSTAIALLAPVLALGVPILDTLLAMARRALARQSIFAADRGHIHHRLLDLGFTHKRVVLTLYSLSVALAVSAVAVAIGHATVIGICLAGFGTVLFVVVRAVARHRLLRRHVPVAAGSESALASATQDAIGELASVEDESAIRHVLGSWSGRCQVLQVDLLAGEPVVSEHPPAIAGLMWVDISTSARRRYLSVRPSSAEHSLDGTTDEHIALLAVACRDALERCAVRSSAGSTARMRVASAHASGSKE